MGMHPESWLARHVCKPPTYPLKDREGYILATVCQECEAPQRYLYRRELFVDDPDLGRPLEDLKIDPENR